MLTETTPQASEASAQRGEAERSSSGPDVEARTVAEPSDAIVAGPLRVVLLAAGFLFVGLATLGVFLPLLPTTPFLLLAAACFAKSSHRFYAMLLGNRVFGPLIRDWRAHGSIPRRAKLLAIAMIVVAMGSTAAFALAHPAARIALLAFGAGLCTWLWRLPTRPQVTPSSSASPRSRG